MLCRELEAVGVHVRVRHASNAETGSVAVEVGEDGERVMRSSRGANQALSPEDVMGLTEAGASIVHLSGYALLGPYGMRLLATARQAADSTGARLSLDPSSVGVINRFGGPDFCRSLAQCGVDLLLPNEREAQALAPSKDIRATAQLLQRYVPVVIVKMGAVGALIVTDSGPAWCLTSSLDPVDTTGAGDAFNAGVLSALYRHESEPTACREGHRLASSAILKYGGRPQTEKI
jgi:sugar/nucleoside kinase (ribokinase family)